MKYFSMSHLYGDNPVYAPSFSVDSSGPTKTGILDPHGDPIYRSAEAIGFVTEYSQPKPRVRVKAVRA